LSDEYRTLFLDHDVQFLLKILAVSAIYGLSFMKFGNQDHIIDEHMKWLSETKESYEFLLKNPKYYFTLDGEVILDNEFEIVNSDSKIDTDTMETPNTDTVIDTVKKVTFTLDQQKELRKLSISARISVIEDYSSDYFLGTSYSLFLAQCNSQMFNARGRFRRLVELGK